MLSVGPWPTIRSFSPEKAHAELACSGAAVRPDVPGMGEGAGGLGVPGGPLTSPATAAPALRTTTKAAQITAATFLRMAHSSLPETTDAAWTVLNAGLARSTVSAAGVG